MSLLGQGRSDVTDDVVLVFRPPENPAAQIAGITPFKSLRLKLDELLSPERGIERQAVALIDSAVGSIEMAAYEFTTMYVEKAILEAIKRGVKVALVLDRLETRGRQAELHDTLERAGCDVRLISPNGGIMHDKYIVVDGKTVEWGSYNYTERAENKNFENATFATDNALAQQYHADFVSIFNQAKPEAHGVRRTIQRFLRHLSSGLGTESSPDWARTKSGYQAQSNLGTG